MPADTRMFTYDGAFTVDPLHFRKEDVNLKHIAHGLSQICRYGGQAPYLYSVAQHSVSMVEAIRETAKDALSNNLLRGIRGQALVRILQLALLHDAHEAYLLGDVVHLLKPHVRVMDDWLSNQLKTIQSIIWDAFGIQPPSPDERRQLKMWDAAIHLAEIAAWSWKSPGATRSDDVKPDETLIGYICSLNLIYKQDPDEAESDFLAVAKELFLTAPAVSPQV